MKNCTTHHYACDCREEKMEAVIDAAKDAIKILRYPDSTFGNHILKILDIAISDYEGKK